jgi:hypothetical protein
MNAHTGLNHFEFISCKVDALNITTKDVTEEEAFALEVVRDGNHIAQVQVMLDHWLWCIRVVILDMQ